MNTPSYLSCSEVLGGLLDEARSPAQLVLGNPDVLSLCLLDGFGKAVDPCVVRNGKINVWSKVIIVETYDFSPRINSTRPLPVEHLIHQRERNIDRDELPALMMPKIPMTRCIEIASGNLPPSINAPGTDVTGVWKGHLDCAEHARLIEKCTTRAIFRPVNADDLPVVINSGERSTNGLWKRHIDYAELTVAIEKSMKLARRVPPHDLPSLVDTERFGIRYSRKGRIEWCKDTLIENKAVSPAIVEVTSHDLPSAINAICFGPEYTRKGHIKRSEGPSII